MKFTKKHRKTNRNNARREATWEKYKRQQNMLNADRQGLKYRP